MLQTVLHCLAQQQRVLGKNVELRGSMTTLPTISARDNAQTIAVTEFIVEIDDVKILIICYRDSRFFMLIKRHFLHFII